MHKIFNKENNFKAIYLLLIIFRNNFFTTNIIGTYLYTDFCKHGCMFRYF